MMAAQEGALDAPAREPGVSLAGIELDHAQDILGDLLNTVVGRLRPTFRLAKLEGDAAFAYVVADTIDPSALQDAVEGTYLAFRRRIRDIKQASRCACDACIRMPSLDLKLVVHHGPVAQQRVAGRDELVGREVILVHRLLRNEVVAATGLVAYALYTEACVAAMGGVDPRAQGLQSHRETIEVIGEVGVWVKDLHAVWRDQEERARHRVEADDARVAFAIETRADPQTAWEYLTSPARRPQWNGADEIRETAPGGRRGAGTTSHCMHGADVILEEILDWRPLEYSTDRFHVPSLGIPKITQTKEIRALPDGGTRIEVRLGHVKGRDRRHFEQVLPEIEQVFRTNLAALRTVLDEVAGRNAQTDAETAREEEPGPPQQTSPSAPQPA
jgi:hypothetical protein